MNHSYRGAIHMGHDAGELLPVKLKNILGDKASLRGSLMASPDGSIVYTAPFWLDTVVGTLKQLQAVLELSCLHTAGLNPRTFRYTLPCGCDNYCGKASLYHAKWCCFLTMRMAFSTGANHLDPNEQACFALQGAIQQDPQGGWRWGAVGPPSTSSQHPGWGPALEVPASHACSTNISSFTSWT